MHEKKHRLIQVYVYTNVTVDDFCHDFSQATGGTLSWLSLALTATFGSAEPRLQTTTLGSRVGEQRRK